VSEAIVYLVIYEGQEESVYTECLYCYRSAVDRMKVLQEQYPDRKYYVYEKDVS